MKSKDRLQQINRENKYINQIKNRQNSLERGNGLQNTYKENPIEYRLRSDFNRNLMKNKLKERDIMKYNNQATKFQKIHLKLNKEKDIVYGIEFNEFIENQANYLLLNRTSQQGKYQTKMQDQDLLVLKERTMRVKNTVDELITQCRKLKGDKAPDLEELREMQAVIRK